MTACDYILLREMTWAASQGINLIGSKNDHGQKLYTPRLDENLFRPRLPSLEQSILF